MSHRRQFAEHDVDVAAIPGVKVVFRDGAPPANGELLSVPMSGEDQ